MDNLESEPRVLIDPNTLSKDGTSSIRGYNLTHDDKIFAYSLSDSDSDWVKIKFKNQADGSDLPDVLEQAKFTGLTWTKDDKGIFYSWYSNQGDGTEVETNKDQKIKYHRLGTKQSEDIICFEEPDNPTWMTSLTLSHDGKYLIVSTSQSCDPSHKLAYVDLEAIGYKINGILPTKKIIDNFDAFYSSITNEEKTFYFLTNHEAPMNKLVAFNIDSPGVDNWKTIIPASKFEKLEDVVCFDHDKIAVVIIKDVVSYLTIRSLKTGDILKTIHLEFGTISYLSAEEDHDNFTFSFTSFLQPRTSYIYSTKTGSVAKFKEPKIDFLRLSEFHVTQEFAESNDKKKIPYFVLKQIGDGENFPRPCKLYGYGGFNISLTPFFSINNLLFVKYFRGIFVLANIRGGSEYGTDWYHGGRKFNKQNCFDDFHSVAKQIIKRRYTKTSLLHIHGGSNGGLLVAACANQFPETFHAVLCDVPVTDILRFHKFTIGHAWTSDFGNPEVKEDFEYALKYSPLHNIKFPQNGSSYPAILVLTADHDDRVVPLHSFKYIATLQSEIGSNPRQMNPLLCRIETNAGHGGTVPTTKRIEQVVDTFRFLELTMNFKDV